MTPADVVKPRDRFRIKTASLYSLAPLLLLLGISIASLPLQTRGLDAGVVLAMSTLALIGVAVHLLANRQKNWLRIDTVFILGFLVVNFQWPFMYTVSNLIPLYSFQSRSLEQSGNFAIVLATISLISWMIGYSFKPVRDGGKRVDLISGSSKLMAVFLLSIVGFSYFAGSSFFNRSIYTTITRDLYMTVSGVGGYFFVVVEILALLTLSYLLYQRLVVSPRKPVRRGAISAPTAGMVFLLIVYCVIFLLGGERGQIVSILVGASLAFATRVRPIRLWEFALLAVVGFIVFSILGILRTGQAASSIALMANYGYWEISTNLAQSIVTLTQAVSIVEERQGFFFGMLWVSQILGIFPFMQGLFLSLTGLTLVDISSAVMITKYTLGENQTSGLGNSFVADIYLNFGIPGIVLFSILYGAICVRMAIWLRGEHGFMRYFVAVAFGSLVLYIARSSILFQLKPIIWGLGFLLLLVQVRRVR